MAKFKKHKRRSTRRRASTTPHRRRRMGATKALSLKMTATNPLFKVGSIALGFFFPDLLPIQKIVGDKLDPKIVAGAEAGLGILLSMKKGKKSMIEVVGGGYLLGAGLKKGLVALGVMSGVGPYNLPVIGNRRTPYGNMPVIASYSPNRSMNGYSPNLTMGYSRPPMKTMNGVSTPGSGYTTTNKGSNYSD